MAGQLMEQGDAMVAAMMTLIEQGFLRISGGFSMTCQHRPHSRSGGESPLAPRPFPLTQLLLVAMLILLPCLAFAAGGDIIWELGDNQPGKQEARASAVDSAGNIVVTGYQNLANDTNDNFLTVKINGNGSGVAWRVLYDKAGGADQATAIAVDTDNNVIVTGYSWNGVNNDIHTIKYDGASGAVLWQHTFNGPANGQDISTSIAVDSLNNIYVGGYSQNSSGSEDYLIIKYAPTGPNPDGTPVWQVTCRGTAPGANKVTSITAGVNGIAVTGQSWNYWTIMERVSLRHPDSEIRLQRYAPLGAPL
jgi:hypothetical protein